MKIIPALDLIENQVVRLTQGDYSRKVIYSSDPVKMAREFTSVGCEHLHLVDLGGAQIAKPLHLDLIGKIKKETGCVIEAGGGIRSKQQVDQYFSQALDKATDFVMIGSLPFKNEVEFNKICDIYLNNILLTVDVWDEEVKISGWLESTNKNIFDFLCEMTQKGINNYLVTQIKKDGMLNGPDFELYQKIVKEFPNINLTASGGVSKLEDFNELKKIKGLYGGILGRAFYEDHVTLEQLKDWN